MEQSLIVVLIAIVAAGFIVQQITLAAVYFSTRKTTRRLKEIAEELQQKALPVLTNANELLMEVKPKLQTTVENMVVTSTAVREQAERMNSTLNDIVDRTRLQVIRADELVSRTMDRVEETTEAVHHVVLSPVRQLSAMMTGLMAGIGEYVGGRRVRRQERAVPQDEMFI